MQSCNFDDYDILTLLDDIELTREDIYWKLYSNFHFLSLWHFHFLNDSLRKVKDFFLLCLLCITLKELLEENKTRIIFLSSVIFEIVRFFVQRDEKIVPSSPLVESFASTLQIVKTIIHLSYHILKRFSDLLKKKFT